MAVLTDVLATKLRGDPDNEYRLEWTEDERLDSAFLVAQTAAFAVCGFPREFAVLNR
jgi:hypothetical protein